MNGQKLKLIRELKNLSQFDVASHLKMKQNSYSRIENNLSKLKAEDATKLAEFFEMNVEDLLSKETPIVSFTNNKIDKGYIHNHYEIQKEALEKLLTAKDAEILLLKESLILFTKTKSTDARCDEQKIILYTL